MTIVAIHQPNFFPWLGYFDKISRADVFIFLDDVQYPKTGGGWSNRVKMLVNGEGRWLTAPINRTFHGSRKINEIEFSSTDNWREKILKTLITAYRRAPFFNEIYSLIEPLVQNPENNIAEYNIHAIKTLTSLFGYHPNSIVKSSDLLTKLSATELSATERLINLANHMNGKTYLCGGGAFSYQEDEVFARSGIKLQYQNFINPTYQQFGQKNFIPGLSIIDTLMNVGFYGINELLKSNHDCT